MRLTLEKCLETIQKQKKEINDMRDLLAAWKDFAEYDYKDMQLMGSLEYRTELLLEKK